MDLWCYYLLLKNTMFMPAQSELSDWLLDDRRPEGCLLESFEPLMSWVVVIEGPDAAPGMPKLYNGERFRWICRIAVGKICTET